MSTQTSLVEKAKNKKFWMIVGAVVIVIALLITTVVVIKRIKKKRAAKKLEEEKKKQLQLDNPGSSPETPMPKDEFPLQIGSKGEYVKQLQKMLNVLKQPTQAKIVEDGDFGNKTYMGVVTYVGSGFYPVTKEKYITIAQRVTDKVKNQYNWNPSPNGGGSGYQVQPS